MRPTYHRACSLDLPTSLLSARELVHQRNPNRGLGLAFPRVITIIDHGSAEAAIFYFRLCYLQLFDDPFNVNKCVIVTFQEEVKPLIRGGKCVISLSVAKIDPQQISSPCSKSCIPVVLLYKNDAPEHLL